jgi:starch-binding outer membrane protein, SusD/RagB family
MNKIKFSILILALSFAPMGCMKDVLDVEPQGQLAEGTLSSSSVVDKLVVATYQALGAHFFGNDEAFAGPSTNWIIDVRSDDAYKGGGGINDRTDIHQLEIATMDPTNFACAQKWRNPMFGIARANYAIREINKLTDAAYPKNARIGEMRLLRGYFHFDLKRNFNQIPYLLEDTDPTTASNTAKTSDELWALIEADFQFAFDNLPTDNGNIGRMNKYTAAGMLAKLYIERNQWDKAIAPCNFIISSNKFSLLKEYENLATTDFENGSETIFAMQFSTANNFANHNWSNLLNVTRSTGIADGGYANGDDFFVGSQNLVNAFKTDANGLPLFDTFNSGSDVTDAFYSGKLDPRVDFTVGRIGIPWKNSAVYSDSWIRSTDYGPGFSGKKHVVSPKAPVHNSFPWAASGLNFQVIRYAEVLLWKAEALIESPSQANLDEARTLINQVRNRAKGSTYVKNLNSSTNAADYLINPYPSNNWTKDYAQKALRFERRLELAMEGNRFYDLLRWGNVAKSMNDYFSTEGAKRTYMKGATFQANKHEYLPIPQSEIDLAPGLYKQNTGY